MKAKTAHPAATDPVTIDDVVAARDRIRDGVYVSPCPESGALSELCGCQVFCKLEYLQRTGSFKERGARNALLVLVPVGGGGLIAGVSLAIKARRAGISIIGVQAAAAGNFEASLRAGRPVSRPARATLADGLAVKGVGERALVIARDRVDRVVTV